MTTPTYQQLIAQGVPPDQASQTIYNNLKNKPRPVVTNTIATPRVKMAKQEEQPSKSRGRPLDPLSMERMLCSVILAQAYNCVGQRYLTLQQIHELMERAYAKASTKPKLPSLSSIQGTLSKLRRGKVKGFPAVDTRGPTERTWEGRRQPVVLVEPRDKEQDIRKNLVDLTLIPDWVVS